MWGFFTLTKFEFWRQNLYHRFGTKIRKKIRKNFEKKFDKNMQKNSKKRFWKKIGDFTYFTR